MHPTREPQDPAEALGLVRRYLDATYRIAQAAMGAKDLQELYGQIHAIARDLMPAENLYFAIWNRTTDTVSFPYFVDAVDPAPPPRTFRRGLTEYVLRTEQPLLLDPEVLKRLEASGEVEPFGTDSLDWLGAPLVGAQGVFGVMAIQIYEGNRRYTPEEQDLLVFVSGQVAMAIERRAAEEALLAERGLFVGGPVMVIKWRVAEGWPVDYVSPNVQAILGYSPEDLVSGRVLYDSLVHPQDVVAIHKAAAGYKAQGLTHYEQHYRLLNAAGEYRWFYDFSTTVTGQGSDPGYHLGYLLDLTDRRQAEEALRHTQKLESLGVLAGGIAHDFNNLLTVMLGNLNLAQLRLPDTSPARPYLANMEATVLRATELTKQMLAYSGRGHFQVRPHDLNAVVRNLTHLLEVSISKKARLQLDLESTLPAIQADAAQLQQVVMNLVTNASDAIGDQEGTIHITTSVQHLDARTLRNEYRLGALQPGRHVVLEVEDTGSGMAAEVMERIFDPFFTTKATGRGLGLSAMLGILRGHGAGLNITSQVGQGSRFKLCFPTVDEAALPATHEDPVPNRRPLHGLVLLVDDEEQILKATGQALESLGFRVVAARDGLEALDRFQEHRKDLRLVLMDLTMPRMDGREAFRAIRGLDPVVPVVLSSGFTEQDSLQTFPDGGPAGFLQKPYQLKDLRTAIERALGS